jgi:sec-independent protein translocase protein TatB
MPDVSLSELTIIALVALLVFGPRRLPELARKVGAWTREVRTVANDLRRGLEQEVAAINEPVRQIKEELEEPRRAIQREVDELKRAADETTTWVGPVAPAGPTPADALEDLQAIDRGEDLLAEEEDARGDDD